jgi:cation diffusion facilitator CzcD-associated flavoprotein CzcO
MTDNIGVLIIGAGPAGLAAGQALRERGIAFEMVERGQKLAGAWHGHYERLHLHTAKRFSALPGLPFGREVARYPSRLQFIEYLRAYAERFHLRPRFGINVEQVLPRGSGWRVRTNQGEMAAENVVLATGLNAVPVRPRWPGVETYQGEVLHSSAYVNAKRWIGRRVLVVGAGNSGAEIALDLTEQGARVELCVRGKLHVTQRDVLGLPMPLASTLLTKLPLSLADAMAQAILRLSVGDLSRWGIETPAHGPLRGVLEHGRVPLIDVGTLARIKKGDIVVRKAIQRFHEDGVTFLDGTRIACDAVVLATGYRSGLERLLGRTDEVLDARGRALHGGIAPRPGLYLVGYATPATGLLREIGFTARRVAAHLAAAQAAR